MNPELENNIDTAELVLPCFDFDKTFGFFTEELGFRIISIFPADNPKVAVVSAYGMRIRLVKTEDRVQTNENIQLNLVCNSPQQVSNGKREIVAPNGVRIKLVDKHPPLETPNFKSKFVLKRFSEDADWVKGRADMRYRDLIPDRLGGSVIASHIHIPNGGIVPDYVHYHNIYFQMIYCRKGWAKLVYEDQGEPFIFKGGDCVLQPPLIRHRVLESSDNLEVIEVSSPADHETFAEHKIALPTDKIDVNREFGGQRFIHHIAAIAGWDSWRISGFEFRDTGIGDATNGLASVKVIRPRAAASNDFTQQDSEFCFIFLLHGRTEFQLENESIEPLSAGDSLVIPPNVSYSFSNYSDDVEMLEVVL